MFPEITGMFNGTNSLTNSLSNSLANITNSLTNSLANSLANITNSLAVMHHHLSGRQPERTASSQYYQ